MRHLPTILFLVVALALAACGDDSSNASGAPAEQSGSTTTTITAAAGKGTGTFVIGDKTFAFDASPCTVDAGSDSSKVEASGKGTLDGRPFTVTVRHSESDTSAIETVQVVFSATEALVGTNFVPLPSGADAIKLKASKDGKAEGTIPVTGTGGQPSGDGHLTLDCGA